MKTRGSPLPHRFFRLRAKTLRAKMVLLFAAGISAAMVFAIPLTYQTTRGVIAQTSERAASAELALIGTSLEAMHEEIAREMDAIATSEFFATLRARDAVSSLSQVYAIRDLYDETRTFIHNFNYVQSVYLFFPDDIVLGATAQNMQRFETLDREKYARIYSALPTASTREIVYLGGLYSGDFPLSLPESASVSHDWPVRIVSAVRNFGDCILVLNIRESYFRALYDSVSDKLSAQPRILNARGELLSALSDDLSGEYCDLVTKTAEGRYTGREMQLVWTTLPDSGMIVTEEVRLGEYWADLTLITRTMLIVMVVGLVMTCAAMFFMIGRAFRPFTELKTSMQRAGRGDTDVYLPVRGEGELADLTQSYNDMLSNLQTLREKNTQIEREKRERELDALRRQLNPHFLFNTLNTIKWMCMMKGAGDAADCITALGGILTPMFRSDKPFWTLREECEMLTLYVSIMNTRLGGGIRFLSEVNQDLLSCQILRFILQPLVENSITHGLTNNAGCIYLTACREDSQMVLRVRDTGQGMEDDLFTSLNAALDEARRDDMPARDESRPRGIGLTNTARRIHLRYGDAYGIRLEKNAAGGVTAVVMLPC